MVNDNKSIMREAISDYKEIMNAADANAKKKLAEEFPETFSKLLKEEINKNKSAKESYKKLDEAQESEKDDTESKKESDMKNQTKETPKVVKEEAAGSKNRPFVTKPKAVANVKEDVKITDTVGDGDPFDEKAKGGKMIDEEREKDFVGDVEAQTPNLGKSGEDEEGKIFNEKIKGPSSGKPISNLKEEFDISELDMNSVDSAINNAAPEDDIITIDEIENEIANMESLGEELNDMGGLPRPDDNQGDPLGQEGDPFKQKLVSMRNEIDEMIANMGNAGEPDGTPPEGMNVRDDLTNYDEQKEYGGKQNYTGRENGGPDTGMIQDEVDAITDDDIDAVLGAPEGEVPVDEHLGISHAANKIKTATLPGNDYVSPQQLSRRRPYGVEESKKLNGLIEENKKLTKKLNETAKYKKTVSTLVESYKSALEKYRNQLKEMAVFNTNLAHVNNLLVNESLALTQDDKIKIINEFKQVDNIAESQKKYKAILSEMKDSKKTITESIENKVSASIQPSSKQKLDEVTEVTAYANDKHIQRMRNLIEYVEHRGKKIIK